MKKLINRFGVPLSVGIIVVALIVAFLSREKPASYPVGDRSLAWYVDEETGEESVLPFAENIPPLPGASGQGTLVQVVKFASDKETTPLAFYWVKYSDAARKQAATCTGDLDELLEVLSFGQLVRSPEPGSPWITLRDPQAAKIISVPEHSPGHSRLMAFPKKR